MECRWFGADIDNDCDALVGVVDAITFWLLHSTTSNNFLSMASDENELHTVRISRIL